jgi:hypothetical protein
MSAEIDGSALNARLAGNVAASLWPQHQPIAGIDARGPLGQATGFARRAHAGAALSIHEERIGVDDPRSAGAAPAARDARVVHDQSTGEVPDLGARAAARRVMIAPHDRVDEQE